MKRLLLLMLTFVSVPAQEPVPASTPQPTVRLELKDGKSSFALGELIPLELVFEGDIPGATVNTTDYEDMAEEVTVTPAAGWFRSHGPSSHDYSNSEKLAGEPIRVPVLLNQGIVFEKPGHYTVTLTTRRLSLPGVDWQKAARPTNSVDVEITAPDDDAEVQRVRLLSSRLAVGDWDEQHKAATELAFLGGDAAIRAKVQWLRGVESFEMAGNLIQDLMSGLASSRNLPLQLRLLEEDWRDTAKVPDWSILSAIDATRACMRRQTQDGWQMFVMPKQDDATKLAQQERADAVHQIVATLPARSGDNRRDTAYFLMENGSLSPQDMAVVRPVVLAEFPRMSTLAQSMLIETRWKDVRDAALVPALKAMLERTDKEANHHDSLERLIELAPDEAQPYVVREICDPKSSVPLSQTSGLPAETLPAADGCLAAQMKTWRERVATSGREGPMGYLEEQRVLLAARYGTEALLPAVTETYAAMRGHIALQYEGAFVAYLLRYAPKQAVAAINADDPGFSGMYFEVSQLYKAIKQPFPPELIALLDARLADGTDEQARQTAYALSEFGSAEDMQLVERRLDKLRMQWTGHEREFESAEYTTPAGKAKVAERDLVSTLLGNGRYKRFTPEQLNAMEAGCMSSECRQNFTYIKQASKAQP